MYLARIITDGRPEFALRCSEPGADHAWTFRTIIHLGPRPEAHIHYPGGNAFYVDEAVSEAVAEAGIAPEGSELEDLFWDYLRPEIRRSVDHFARRRSPGARHPVRSDPPPGHRFDHRRLLFLRSGGLDQRRLPRVPPRFFAPLLDKSRDEIEQLFLDMERRLRARDVKTYLYVAFDLQRFFESPMALRFPGAMDPDRLDEGFLETACALHGDRRFWAGHPRGDRIDPYLVRYITAYFDTDFPRENPMGAYARDFMNRHRHRRMRPAAPLMPRDQAAAVMGFSAEALGQLDRRTLIRRYRQLALKRHPDQGGDTEAFVQTTTAFRSLLKRLKRGHRD